MHIKWEILKNYIKDTDKVLDLGAWSCPFRRADIVIDYYGYEDRGKEGFCGPKEEKYNKDSWLVMDFINQKLPFKDKEIDFLNFTSTLEDVKDPISILNEIIRVAKAGYIEFPSRANEQSYNTQGKWKIWQKFVGFYNHRWFVEYRPEENEFLFTPKYSVIHFFKELIIKSKLLDEVDLYLLENNEVNRVKAEDKAGFVGLLWRSDKINNVFKFKEISYLMIEDFRDNCLKFKANFDRLNKGQVRKLKKKTDKKLSLSLTKKVKYKILNILKI